MTDDLDTGGKNLSLEDEATVSYRLKILRTRLLVRHQTPKEVWVLLYNLLGIDKPKEHMPGKPGRKRWH